MRGWKALACAAVALVVPVLPAGAASQNVTATPSNTFEPASVTILQGESVTWNNSGGGFHNVHFDGNSYVQPPAPDSSTWSVSRTFLAPGTYTYYCEAHEAENMRGTVTVLPPGSPPPPPPPVGDKSAPALKLSGKSSQRVLRQRGVRLVVRVNEAAAVVVRGKVSVPGTSAVVRTKEATAQLTPRRNKTMRVKFSNKGLSRIRNALRKRSRLTARLTVTATDRAGNKRTLKSKFALRR
jgi:plastocyanin